jgi:small subunit ribosomal protein S15
MAEKTKSQIIGEFKKNETDTGSIEVQIALLTDRIQQLTEHFGTHPKDFGSKRGLLVLVGRRRRFLRYLENSDPSKYRELLERLELRK